MKRHLISCHGTCDELLRKLSFDVERLRRNCLNRPAINELPIIPKEQKRSTSATNCDGQPKEKVKKESKKSSTDSTSLNNTNSHGGATRGRPRKNPIKPLNGSNKCDDSNFFFLIIKFNFFFFNVLITNYLS